ncbi:MAG TPA: endopeptidase La [Gemmatimonadaceae bacterium]|nr:endopeptidase La [Gemmatimonadaceae bacterium]
MPAAAERLPVLPLRDVVFFPHLVMPLLVGRGGSLAALDAAAAAPEPLVLLVTQRDSDVADPAAGDLYRVGVVARVLQLARMPNGVAKVLLEGTTRARVSRYVPSAGLLRALTEPAPLAPVGAADDPGVFDSLARRVVALFEEYVELQRRVPAEVVQLVRATDDPERRAHILAAHLEVAVPLRQELLELPTLPAVYARLGDLLGQELELLRLGRKIEDDVRGALVRNQREYFLQEQLKAIHRELGQEEDELAELEAQLAAKQLPEAVEQRARRELRRLRRLAPTSPEAGVARGFLDWLLALPWGERDDVSPDVGRAARVLDEDHYGLAEVKDRILDHVAVLAATGRLDGPVLCLAGPPGVGKTSLGRSIARALGRRFVRMSLGGVRDEAEIRGHRRTYVGAMPGRIVQAMRRAGVANPVILLDEVDKLGQDYRGDPSAALLEVLDPEQRHAFSDHFLEVDYDLSQVLFVTTANSLAGIPEPLRDRMEIIRLPGYLDQEKLAIARQYLLPRQLRAHGVDPETVTVDDAALQRILRGYTREAGVRELDRRLARLARKLARRRAEAGGAAGPVTIGVDELPALLGPAPYDPDATSLEDRVGVASGLAYTPAGGEVLEIEVSAVPGRGRLQLTGTLGEVMKESASTALSCARARAAPLGIDPEFHRTRDLHLHIPSGAVPKDGPSAGVAIASAIVSALTGVPVRGDVAMTGEVTLRGRVLAVGGVREKVVAARRAGIREIVLPAANRRQLDELPAEVRDGLTFHPVESLDEVLTLTLRGGMAPTSGGSTHGTPAGSRRRRDAGRARPRATLGPDALDPETLEPGS